MNKLLDSMGDIGQNRWHWTKQIGSTVKLGNKERFDKEHIGSKEPFPVTNLPFTFYG